MSDLYFSVGNENDRGTLPSSINKIIEGQLSVGISNKRPGVRSEGKLIGDNVYDNWHLTTDTSKDARAYLDISNDLRIPINAYFSDYSHFATCIESISNKDNLQKLYLLGTTGTDTTPMYDTDIFISNTTKGALTSKYLLLNNSLGIGVTDFVTDKAFHVKGDSKFEGISELTGNLLVNGNTTLGDSSAEDIVTLNAITIANNSIKYTTEASSKRILYGSVENSGIKYDKGDHGCLMFSSGTNYFSSIQFYTSNRISLNDNRNQWNASDVIPDLHIKDGCVAINYNWGTGFPTYNLYVGGNACIESGIEIKSNAYIDDDITIGGSIILSNTNNNAYGTSLPATGSPGQVFFKLI